MSECKQGHDPKDGYITWGCRCDACKAEWDAHCAAARVAAEARAREAYDDYEHLNYAEEPDMAHVERAFMAGFAAGQGISDE